MSLVAFLRQCQIGWHIVILLQIKIYIYQLYSILLGRWRMDFVNVSPTRTYLSYCRFIELQFILSYHVGEKFQKKSLLLLFLFLLLPSNPLFLSIFIFTFLYAYYYLFHVQFFSLHPVSLSLPPTFSLLHLLDPSSHSYIPQSIFYRRGYRCFPMSQPHSPRSLRALHKSPWWSHLETRSCGTYV